LIVVENLNRAVDQTHPIFLPEYHARSRHERRKIEARFSGPDTTSALEPMDLFC
jgi:hypothetical protein